jgi:NAD(P)-dependent dehydrogenase (short-subunit alcohol dehydrogenase family)
MRLSDSISAVVTGGASGLGYATAAALRGRGVKVAILDRDASRGEAAARTLGALFFETDVTSDSSVGAALAKARSEQGQERVLVNCAGIGNAIRTVGRPDEAGQRHHFPIEDFEKVVQVNLIGSFRCLAKSALGMVALDPLDDGERGVIINTASIAAHDGQIGQAAYSASKGGVLAMALPIARDLMNDGIRVNTILPGIFETPLLHSGGQKMVDALSAMIPFPKRLGLPEEYADLALFMIHNGYINGEHVRLDGAIRLSPK